MNHKKKSYVQWRVTSIPPHFSTRNKFVLDARERFTPISSPQSLGVELAADHFLRSLFGTPWNIINTRVTTSGVGFTVKGADFSNERWGRKRKTMFSCSSVKGSQYLMDMKTLATAFMCKWPTLWTKFVLPYKVLDASVFYPDMSWFVGWLPG